MTQFHITPKPKNNAEFLVSFVGQTYKAIYSAQYEMLMLSNGHCAHWDFVDTYNERTKIIKAL